MPTPTPTDASDRPIRSEIPKTAFAPIMQAPEGARIVPIPALFWNAASIKEKCEEIENDSTLQGEKGRIILKFNGPAPAWATAALAHSLHPHPVTLYDPKVGYIDIPALKIEKELCEMTEEQRRESGYSKFSDAGQPYGGVKFELTEGENIVKISFSIAGEAGHIYDYKDLPFVVTPDIPEGKSVAIDGRGPNWLVAAIAAVYSHKAPTVLFHQPTRTDREGNIIPGTYTIGISHNAQIGPRGEVFSEEAVEDDIKSLQDTPDGTDTPDGKE